LLTAKLHALTGSRSAEERSAHARADEDADVQAAIQRLKPAHRQVLVLRFFLDLPLEEISEVLHLPTGTVKSRLNRGIEAIRAALREDHRHAE
jgi:RNA polymerase sigma factor (sigma-70 family)